MNSIVLKGDLYHNDLLLVTQDDGDLAIEREDIDGTTTFYLSPAQLKTLREFLPILKQVKEAT